MKKIIRTERGWAGHFICAMDCRFRRNTLLQLGKLYIVVSTVGAMFRMGDDKAQAIGSDRYYETMAFYSDEGDTIYHDINVSRQIYIGAKWSINKKEMNENKDEIDNIANKMHEDYVKSIERMMLNGEL